MRYIDADRFEVVTSQRHSEDFIDGMDYILDMIDKAPTEDVVPRSEVEKLSIELEAMRGAANSYKMHYEQAKQEVASEIFEEIKNFVHKVLNDKTYTIGDMCWDIENSSKKYIGEKK